MPLASGGATAVPAAPTSDALRGAGCQRGGYRVPRQAARDFVP